MTGNWLYVIKKYVTFWENVRYEVKYDYSLEETRI